MKCECGHFWTEHDPWGCHHDDGCTRIDRHTRYDKATKSAVPIEREDEEE